jgi:hypothetical protein
MGIGHRVPGGGGIPCPKKKMVKQNSNDTQVEREGKCSRYLESKGYKICRLHKLTEYSYFRTHRYLPTHTHTPAAERSNLANYDSDALGSPNLYNNGPDSELGINDKSSHRLGV